MSDFKAKVYQIRFRLRLCPRPRWERLQRSPRRPSSWRRGVAAPKNSTSPLSTLWTSTPLFSRIFLSRPWHVWNYVIWWQRFNVRWTSWSRLDCLQLNGTSDLEITWSYVWLSWQDSASRFMQISVFLIQSASYPSGLLLCLSVDQTSFALSQSMTWFISTAWSVMADLWVTLLSLALEVWSVYQLWNSPVLSDWHWLTLTYTILLDLQDITWCFRDCYKCSKLLTYLLNHL